MIVVMRLSQLLNLITRFSSVYLFYVCIYMINYLFELGLRLVGLYVLIIAFICCLLSKKILREGAAWENSLRACCKNMMHNANLYYKLVWITVSAAHRSTVVNTTNKSGAFERILEANINQKYLKVRTGSDCIKIYYLKLDHTSSIFT